MKGGGLAMERDNASDLIEYFNLEFATPGDVSHDLRECLSVLRKTALDEIARYYAISRRTKLKKAELINRLFETLSSDEEIERKLLVASCFEWDFWQELYNAGVLQDNYAAPSACKYLLDVGLAYSYMKDGLVSFVIPDQIRIIFKRLMKGGFEKKRERYLVVFNYATAMANLYGAVDTNMLYDTIAEQNDIQMNYDEFLHILMEYLFNEQGFTVYNGYVIDSFLDDDDYNDFEELLEMTKGKPFCKLEKDELLKFSGDFICEQTQQLFNLRDFIREELYVEGELALDIAEEIAFYCRMDLSVDMHTEVFEQRHLKFKDARQARAVFALVCELNNSVRKWVNRGYSPYEVTESEGPPVIEHKTFPISTALLSAPPNGNVGRNDPCPCGSGKKYKKCCGKLS